MADTSTNNLSVSLPTDFLTGAGGLNLNFNFGGNADAIASGAYSFVNQGLSNANGFLAQSISQTQGFVQTVAAPSNKAVATITKQMGDLLPSMLSNLFTTANTAYSTEGTIASSAFQAQQAIAQASIASSNQSAGSGGLCFITTAVCEATGLADDCDALTVLRAFRDSYMQATPERRALVSTYYAVAPGFVTRIRARGDAAMVFDTMRDHFITPAVHAIARGDDADAFALYCALVEYASHKAHEGSA